MIPRRSPLLALALIVPPAFAAVLAVERSPVVPVAQEDPAGAKESLARKKRKVQDLLEAMGQKDIAKRSVEQMLDSFKEMGLPEDFAEKFKARFDIDELLAMSVDVYSERLDESTIDATAAFYATEEGKKLAAATPEITLECLKRGQEYGRNLAEEIMREK